MQWASVLFVVCLVLRNADGAVISNYSLYGANISSACASAPAWKLNLCNLTCATCVASNPDLCSTCDANYVYDSSYCYTSDLYNFYYFTSLLTSPVIPLSEANMLIMGITGSPLLYSDMVDICTANQYSFSMMGLFTSSDEIILPLTYTEVMQEFTLKFNLLFLLNLSTLTVTFKSSSGTIEKISNIYDVAEATGYYAPSNVDTQTNYLNLPSMTVDNVRTFIQPVTIDVKIYTSEVDISFMVTSPNAVGNDYHWAISDITVLAAQCNTCVTTEVSNTITFVGMFTLYVLAGTLVLLALLACCMCIIRWRKEMAAMAKANSGKDYLPIKPVDRVINTIERKGKA